MLERPQRQHRVGTREDDVREVAVLLPGPEEERLVAEQEVVGTARLGEEALGLGAGGLALVRLPVEQLRRSVRGPAHLEDDQQHGDRHGRRREPPGAAQDPGRHEDGEEGEHEDQVARLGRRRPAEASREEGRHRHADHAEGERAGLAADADEADQGE